METILIVLHLNILLNYVVDIVPLLLVVWRICRFYVLNQRFHITSSSLLFFDRIPVVSPPFLSENKIT